MTYAASFSSLHDGQYLSKLLNNKNFINKQSSLTFSKEYTLIQHTKKTKDGKYYHPNGWLRFKYYVPAGTSVRLVLSTMPNTSMRIDLKYKADKNNIIDHIDPIPNPVVFDPTEDPLYAEDQPTVEHIAINTFNQIAYNLNQGGWIYVSIVENSAEIQGDHGFIESSTVIVNYTLEIVDQEKFKNWLFKTSFTRPGGDPVDNIDKIIEYDNVLKNNEVLSIEKILSLNVQNNYKLDPSIDILKDSIPVPSNVVNSSTAANDTSESGEYQILEHREPSPVQSIQTTVSDENLTDEQKQDIQMLQSKQFSVDGYFVHVDQKWIYVSNKTKNIYKLKGMNKDGSLKWVKIPNIVPVMEGDQIKFIPSTQYNNGSFVKPSENSSIESSNKSCPSGYTYDSGSGFCRQNLNSNSSQSSNETYNNGNSAIGTLPTPASTTQQTSTKHRSCPSGYTYDPDVGMCR